jgi:hypothetical protein
MNTLNITLNINKKYLVYGSLAVVGAIRSYLFYRHEAKKRDKSEEVRKNLYQNNKEISGFEFNKFEIETYVWYDNVENYKFKSFTNFYTGNLLMGFCATRYDKNIKIITFSHIKTSIFNCSLYSIEIPEHAYIIASKDKGIFLSSEIILHKVSFTDSMRLRLFNLLDGIF